MGVASPPPSLQRVSLQRVLAAAPTSSPEELQQVVEEVLNEEGQVYGYKGVCDAATRTLPLWLTVLLLLLTRIPQLQLQAAFQR
jgi:hypothetical protein